MHESSLNFCFRINYLFVQFLSGFILILSPILSKAQSCAGIFSFTPNPSVATCNASDGSIQIQGVSGGTGNYSFSLFGGPGQVPAVPPLNDFLFPNLGSGTYTITISDGFCDTTITVAVPSQGGITDATVILTNPSCNATDGAIAVTPIPAGATVGSFTLNTGTTSATGNFTGLGSGNYSIIMIDGNNCIFTLSDLSLTEPIGPTNILTTSSEFICRGGKGSIVVDSVRGGTGPYKFSLNGAAFQSISSWDNVSPGTYLLTVKDNNGCTVSKTIIIKEAVGQINDCSAGPDLLINYGENVTIQGIQGSGTEVSWTPSNSLSDTSIVNPIAFPPLTTIYTLTVRTAEGCKCTDIVTVRVIPLIDIPNTFTPNGDGINDTWSPNFTQFYESVEVFIYNRYGDKIYNNREFKNGDEWDGTNNGVPLPPATYYYVLNFKFADSDAKYTYTGGVTIIR